MRSKGFILIELFVAIVVFGFVAMAATAGLVNAFKLLEHSRNASKAALAATNIMEKLRFLPLPSINNSTEEVLIGGKRFQVSIQACPSNTICNDQTKSVLLSVIHNSKVVYETNVTITSLR